MHPMTGPTLDSTVLADLRTAMDNDDLVAELVATFQADTPGQLAALAAAHQRGDLASVVTQAHLVKGGALIFGAVRLVQLCEALEADPSGPGERVTALAREFEELTLSLSAFLEALPGT